MISRRLFLRAAPAIPAALASPADAEDPKRIVWIEAGRFALCADGSRGPQAARCFIYLDGVLQKRVAEVDARGPIAYLVRYRSEPNGERYKRLWGLQLERYIEAVDRRRVTFEFRGPRDAMGRPI